MIAWPLVRVNDEARSDYSLEGPAAAKVLLELKLLLADGGRFFARSQDLPNEEGSNLPFMGNRGHNLGSLWVS